MSKSVRKFVGGIALIVFSISYYWMVISIAIMRLPGLATPWHILFYFVVTVVWFIPCAALIWWIQVDKRANA